MSAEGTRGSFRVERLAKQRHAGFACGVPALDDYLRKRAGQDQRRRVAVCHLLVEQSIGTVAGYYTLSAGAVRLDALPASTASKLPRSPSVPIARMGRLAVATPFQGRGLGGVLVADAMNRAAAAELGVFALVVDAKDGQAAAFYEHLGFKPLTGMPRTLFLAVPKGV